MSAIWDILQHVQINKAKQAMWELLSDRLGVTDDELKAKILEVDARDGVVDGKLGAEILDCPNCGHKVSTSAPRCTYCGHNTPSGDHVMR